MNTPFPLDQTSVLSVGARLSEQLADALVVSIRDGQLPEGQRLPAMFYLAGLTCTEETFMTKAGAQRHAADGVGRGGPSRGESDSPRVATGWPGGAGRRDPRSFGASWVQALVCPVRCCRVGLPAEYRSHADDGRLVNG